MTSVDADASARAKNQFGVLSRRQLVEVGMTNAMIRSRVRRGLLVPLHPAAYLVGGAPSTWEGQLLAAHLWLGTASLVSHRSAARLYGLEGYNNLRILELTLLGTGRVRISGILLHRSKTVRSEDVRQVDPFACVGPERLMLDLAAVVSPRMLEVALDSLLFKGMTTFERVGQHLQDVRASGLTGVRRLEALLEGRDPRDAPAESFFETDFYRFLRDSPHHDAVFQHEVFDQDGLVGRLDVAYPAKRVGLEAHSLKWHSSAERVRSDAKRHNRLTASGWRILYETYDNLKSRPEEILRRLEVLLRSNPAA